MKRTKRKYRVLYHLSIFSILLLGAAAVFIGSSIVSVNCYNAMNSSQMVLFDIKSTDDGVIVTFMDKDYIL